MSCPRCTADPTPRNSAPRSCAFDTAGVFTPDNWRCATLEALTSTNEGARLACSAARLYGHDETIDIVPAALLIEDHDDGWDGWIVLTRYKQRGRCSSAVHVGDFFPARPITLALAEATLTYRERNV